MSYPNFSAACSNRSALSLLLVVAEACANCCSLVSDGLIPDSILVAVFSSLLSIFFFFFFFFLGILIALLS